MAGKAPRILGAIALVITMAVGTISAQENTNHAPRQTNQLANDLDENEAGVLATGLVIHATFTFLAILFAVEESRHKWLGERRLLAASTITGAALLAGFTLLFLLEAITASTRWAWWKHAHITWQQWLAFSLATTVTLQAGATALAHVPQPREARATIAVLVMLLAMTATAFLLFVVLDISPP